MSLILPKPPPSFDDFLGLGSRRLDGFDAVIFTGASGSGKSTAMSHLLDAHEAFQEPATLVCGESIGWSELAPSTRLVVVDEMRRVRDLLGIMRLLRAGHRVLAANHLPSALIRVLGLRFRIVQFQTDSDSVNLERELERRRIEYSTHALRAFVRRYGATFTDLHLVLERAPVGASFDEAWERFQRSAWIRTAPRRAQAGLGRAVR